MNYTLTQTPSLFTSECLVLGLYAEQPLPDFALALDKACEGLITRLSQRLTEAGDMLWQHEVQGRSILMMHCGTQQAFQATQLQKRVSDVTKRLLQHKVSSVTWCMPQLADHTPDWQLEQMLLQIDNLQYQLLDFKKKNPKASKLESISFYLPNATSASLDVATAVAAGVALTRNLGNMPANICTPTYLGEQATALAKQFQQIRCKVMGPEEMQQLGMNTLLAVAQGSTQPPRLVELQYQGGDSQSAPIVLVGKGITFDSGGLSLKSANLMDEMKYDMCGAASVLGVLKACALLQLPIHVVGIIACAENLPSGAAVKPGDIVTSMSGQTVEIINTDAEGRLVLADALTYAERFHPRFVIDIATLTGAVIVALGAVNSGLMTQDEDLATRILAAAKTSQDKVWRLPLEEEYQEAIASPLADMLNATFDRGAGSITAACFLSRFTEKFPWAHLDVAGTAWVSGKNRNATGRPVVLLMQLLRDVANAG